MEYMLVLFPQDHHLLSAVGWMIYVFKYVYCYNDLMISYSWLVQK